MRVQDLVASGQLSARARVLVTGHSLGGALAVLAAFDIKQAISSFCIEMYTYGTPYPGNRAFAREFNELLPEAWQVIHDGVSKVGCLLCPAGHIAWQLLETEQGLGCDQLRSACTTGSSTSP